MIGFITSALIGVLCIVLGIINTQGNISSIHSYHRKRVKEEDVLPFGRLVGLGTIIVGAGIILFSILGGIDFFVGIGVLTYIGIGILFPAIAAGLVICVYAMKKYNGGVF